MKGKFSALFFAAAMLLSGCSNSEPYGSESALISSETVQTEKIVDKASE